MLKGPRLGFIVAVTLIAVLFVPQRGDAYSVLTHEELIDLAWASSIRPLLLARFPGSTDAQLREAHAYAYGGCAIQDMGYYPFGHEFFSDLTHYARTGDFINNLFREARTLDEYAFAIGALSHYLGDSIGHSEATNPATAIAFPKLERRYGPIVTYDESPHGHVRTEFAFDIGQLTKRGFAPPAYLRFVGFKVPRKLLERAFLETYGFDIHEVLGRAHPALKSYRSSVRSFIPRFAEAEVVLHRCQFVPNTPGTAYDTFSERISRTAYERHWAQTYRDPGFGAHVLAIVIRVLPKVGPISLLAIKIPNTQTEGWYVASVNRTVDTYRGMLDTLRTSGAAGIPLPNRDLDTGNLVKPGGYPLTDKTYAKLLDRLTSKPGRVLPAGLRQNILAYYSDPNAPITTKKNAKAWKRATSELEILKQMKSAD
ncbi:MAG: zinc dependent phospholipase C family protein [Candidatus Acidiferrales bacterium]